MREERKEVRKGKRIDREKKRKGKGRKGKQEEMGEKG